MPMAAGLLVPCRFKTLPETQSCRQAAPQCCRRGRDMPRLNEYGTVTPALDDSVLGLDVSDTTESADGSAKRFTVGSIVDLVPAPVDGASAYDIAVANGFVGTEAAWLASLDGTDGDDGEDGQGVPAGGTTGQILAKASDTDLDTAWIDPAAGGSLPVGASEGQVLAWIGGAAVWQSRPDFITLVKTADETVVSSNVYQDDDELVSPTLEANSVYRFELMLCFGAGTAEDMRFRIGRTGLGDANLRYASDLDNAGAGTLTFNSNINCPGTGVGSFQMGNYIGFLITGANTGSIVVQWAQQIAGVNVTTMRAGSMMMLRKVG
jgi:hypothetical protein